MLLEEIKCYKHKKIATTSKDYMFVFINFCISFTLMLMNVIFVTIKLEIDGDIFQFAFIFNETKAYLSPIGRSLVIVAISNKVSQIGP